MTLTRYTKELKCPVRLPNQIPFKKAQALKAGQKKQNYYYVDNTCSPTILVKRLRLLRLRR